MNKKNLRRQEWSLKRKLAAVQSELQKVEQRKIERANQKIHANKILSELKDYVEEFFQTKINGHCRRVQSVNVRYIYIGLARNLFQHVSNEDIGKPINRVPCSIVHGLRKFDAYSQTDPQFKNMLWSIKSDIIQKSTTFNN